MFLKQIVQSKEEEVQQLIRRLDERDQQVAAEMPPVRSLSAAMQKDGGSIIAEIKPASPSKGVIQADVDPMAIATEYVQGGARAISVLTDQKYFHGHAQSLTLVRASTQLPVLRKDFIIAPEQVIESRLIGADAILLIVAILRPEQCRALSKTAHEYGLEVLIEVHDESELEVALTCEPDVIGINNRNLSTFQTDLSTTEQLRPLIDTACPVITESGIHSPADVHRMLATPVDGLLIGEYLMRQTDRQKALQELLTGDPR